MFGPSDGARSGSGWVSMKTAATPDRHRRPRHHRGELALPAGGGALAARLLHRVGRVHHHRVAGARHDRQAAHVGDQRVVAEARAALAEQDALVAGRGDLGGDVHHVPGREELALLHVDRRPGARRPRAGGRSGATGRPGSAARPPPRPPGRSGRAGARRSGPGSRSAPSPRRGCARPSSMPMPRRAATEVRLALS